MNHQTKTSVILLAGGTGTRMQSATPKQFLGLNKKAIACHSYDVFLDMPEIDEIVVVCAPDFRHLFAQNNSKPVIFAMPGERRQDSVYNGLQEASHEIICIHDAARPFIDHELVLRVLKSGLRHGAATVGMPIKYTIKETAHDHFVKNTPDRSNFWEIQTPQVLHRDLLVEGFKYAEANGITVTDDVSLAELLGKQVKLVEGSHKNLKLTVPSDMTIATQLLNLEQ